MSNQLQTNLNKKGLTVKDLITMGVFGALLTVWNLGFLMFVNGIPTPCLAVKSSV